MPRSWRSSTRSRSRSLDVGPIEPDEFARLPVPRPVERYRYVARRCRGLRVVDLGAYDETEVDRPQHGRWRWLHAEIAAGAAEVLGVDASEKLRQAGEVRTRCGTRIVYGTVEDLGDLVEAFDPDLVVAGELIEHTPNTLGWLSRLADIRPGTNILLTTPNTTSAVNILLAVVNRENCHPDHLHVYSFKTLTTLAGRVPIHDVRIRPYYYDPHLFLGKIRSSLVPLASAANTLLLKPIQYAFPLTSFGLILEGVLGPPPQS